MKRTGRAVMLVFVLLMGLVLVNVGTTVSYADTFFTEGDFRYAVTTGDKVLLAGYNGDSMDVILPGSVNGRAVVGVRTGSFENASIHSIVIPEGYTTIGAFAFSGCQSLETVLLPASLKTIGMMAFNDCSTLSEIDFDAAKQLESISFGAFRNCPSLSGVYLPETITEIGDNAFAPANAVICFEDTAAAAYCQNSGAAQARILKKIMGDVNFDTDVNINDVTAIQRHLCESERFAPYQMITADRNGDGRVSVDDATLIQMLIAEFDVQW